MVWFLIRKRRHRVPYSTLVATVMEMLKIQGELMADLTRLQAAVAANTQAVEDIKAVIAAGGTPQADIDAIATQVEANTAALEALKPPPAG